MDLGYVGGLTVLTGLGTVEVLDVVLQECHHHSQPNLVSDIHEAGVKVITTKMEWLAKLTPDLRGQLSIQDNLNLYYAGAYERILLTNEKRLRVLCEERGVSVHGTLWIIGEAHSRKIEKPSTLCGWLDTLSTLDRRLPKEEVVSLKQLLGCA